MVDHPPITPVEVFDCLESTQTEALSRLRGGDAGPRWIQAHTQTAGLGRKGPVWQSPEGNLFASWYQAVELDLRTMPQLAFVAGLAVHDVLRPVVRDETRLRIKWPNDVLYDGAKLCGILVQSVPVGTGLTGIIAGIGINVQTAPVVEAYDTAAVSTISQTPLTVQQVMESMNRQFHLRFKQWQGGGFADMAEEWFRLAYGRERLCVVDDGPLRGEMTGLNQDGSLLIRLENTGRIQAVSSGTVRYQEGLCS